MEKETKRVREEGEGSSLRRRRRRTSKLNKRERSGGATHTQRRRRRRRRGALKRWRCGDAGAECFCWLWQRPREERKAKRNAAGGRDRSGAEAEREREGEAHARTRLSRKALALSEPSSASSSAEPQSSWGENEQQRDGRRLDYRKSLGCCSIGARRAPRLVACAVDFARLRVRFGKRGFDRHTDTLTTYTHSLSLTHSHTHTHISTPSPPTTHPSQHPSPHGPPREGEGGGGWDGREEDEGVKIGILAFTILLFPTLLALFIVLIITYASFADPNTFPILRFKIGFQPYIISREDGGRQDTELTEPRSTHHPLFVWCHRWTR